MTDYYKLAAKWLHSDMQYEDEWTTDQRLAAAQVAAGLAQAEATRELIRDTARRTDRP